MALFQQFDVLWEALTAREHLYLFGSIKGLPSSEIKEVSVKHMKNLGIFLIDILQCQQEMQFNCCSYLYGT